MKKKIWAALLYGFIAGVLVAGICLCSSQRHSLRVTNENWMKLNLILRQVENNYVDEVDKEAVTDAAVEAALHKLDPHSVYLRPEPLKEAEEDLAGGFEGIGIMFNVPNDTAVVITVIPGGPSEKAGLATGDRILKVNERVIAGNKTPQDTMVRLMKGPKGTEVTITVGRDGEKIPFAITRDKIPEHCVDAAFMVNDTMAYMRLSKFTRTTFQECHNAAAELRTAGMRHLILDLRGNTGGYFDQACNLANDFLPENALIVYMEGLHRKRDNVYANGRGAFTDIGLSVLIDDSSASASEIFAGAIQDNDRGTIVGRRSFGKGLVQEPIYFTDGSGIRLTVARFYTPSGRCIQKPYSDDYNYDFYSRYTHGELVSADSIKVDSSKVYSTVGGRTVYGGGGIIPDVFVPMDTTRVTAFHLACNRKAAVVRFATHFFDSHRSALASLADFDAVNAYLDRCGIEKQFLSYAASLGIKPAAGEWEKSKQWLMPQVRGLCARWSKLGEEAYYRCLLPVDNAIRSALSPEEAER